MLSLIRYILGITVLISKEDALRIAMEHCRAQAWPWLEPVHTVFGIRYYEILTNAASKGGNVTIRVDCSTGTIAAAAYAHR